MKEINGTITLAYVEEDNRQRVIFRVIPLCTREGNVFHGGAEDFPDEGSLRIVPDKREQSTFKERMREAGGLCAIQLASDGKELMKVRQNRNYAPEEGERNQYAIYSDVICELAEDGCFEVVEPGADASQALTAKVLLHSVDFEEIEACQAAGDWDRSAAILGEAARNLERAGADLLVICTNTMHKVAPQIQAQIHIPLVHIAEATADALHRESVSRVALLGTKYTMTQDFYKDKLIASGIDVLIPEEDDIAFVNRVIYDELCLGVISEDSRRGYLAVIDKLAARGAQGVILGCTEIGLLIRQSDTALPVFDTTRIHAERAAALALES